MTTTPAEEPEAGPLNIPASVLNRIEQASRHVAQQTEIAIGVALIRSYTDGWCDGYRAGLTEEVRRG